MNPNKVIIKFEQVADQPNDVIRRLTGFVQAKYLVDLIDAADLNANPRSAKVGNVTDDIIDSIKKTKDIFPFKTKGILLAVSTLPRELERKRYELEFKDYEIEGILDGGHNTLAIAIHILNVATEDDRAIRRIKSWSDLKNTWSQYKDKVADIRDQLDFLVPIEILVPANDTEETQETFRRAILDICAARNNNVQLKLDTKANQAGHYEAIKQALDPRLAKEVIWKTNEPGRIPVRDIVALSWIPLSVLELPEGVNHISPVQLYSSKGKCMEAFVELMENPAVSELVSGSYVLRDQGVASAFVLLKDLPRLYDKIYMEFPDAYNKADGKFGRISSVKWYNPGRYAENPKKYLRTPPTSTFHNEAMDYQYADGFIMPLVCALSALIEEQDGKLKWKVDPDQFLQQNLPNIVRHYKGVLDLSQWDPAKVGKNSVSYAMAKQQFEHYLLMQEHESSVGSVAAMIELNETETATALAED
jgi:hypothetical protein